MKKIIISLINLLIFINFINPTDELVKRTIMMLPFYNESKVEQYNYISNVIRDSLRTEIEMKNIFKFIEYSEIDKNIKQEQYIKNDSFEKKNVLMISINLKADIVIFCKYNISNEKIIIMLNAIDVLTGYTVIEIVDSGNIGVELFKLIDKLSQNIAEIMSRQLTLIRKSYYEKKLKEQEEKIKKELELEEKKQEFHKNYNITIGAGLLAFAYQYKDGKKIQDKTNSNLTYGTGSMNYIKFGIFFPFSFSYYFHKISSIGFTFKIGYNLGLADFYNLKADESFNISNGLMINLMVKHRFGKFNSRIKFLLEYGLLLELDSFLYKQPYKINNAGKEYTRFYGSIFFDLGPIIFTGLEIQENNFSFEPGLFISSTYGIAGKNDYNLDTNLPNYNYIVIGLEMRFNFYMTFNTRN